MRASSSTLSNEYSKTHMENIKRPEYNLTNTLTVSFHVQLSYPFPNPSLCRRTSCILSWELHFLNWLLRYINIFHLILSSQSITKIPSISFICVLTRIVWKILAKALAAFLFVWDHCGQGNFGQPVVILEKWCLFWVAPGVPRATSGNFGKMTI